MSGWSQRERNENQLIVMNSRYSKDVPYLPPPAVSPLKPTHLRLSALRYNHKPLGSKRKTLYSAAELSQSVLAPL